MEQLSEILVVTEGNENKYDRGGKKAEDDKGD
jgi:hypothetical protein